MIDYKYSCKGKLHANDNPWTGVPIKLNVPAKDINQKVVIITVSATYDPPMERKLSDDTILDLATYSNSISNMWTYKHHEEAKNVRHYLYLPPLESNDLDNISLRIVVSTRHNVRYSLSVELENIDIDLSKPRYSTLTLDSPTIYRFNYQNKSKSQRIRVHTTRIDSRPLNEVQEGCSIVSIQNLDWPFKYNDVDFTFRSRWQTMLGRSVIDVDGNERECLAENVYFEARGQGQGYYRAQQPRGRKGFSAAGV